MDEILRKRIERKLDGLPEDKGYQVLDYIEFLESKYGSTARQPTPVERITEGVGDALRAVKVPANAIRGTMGVVDSASRMMQRLVAAGRAAVEELQRSPGAPSGPSADEAAESAAPAPSAGPAPAGESGAPAAESEPAQPGGTA